MMFADYYKAKKMSTSLTSLQPNSQSLERQKHVKTTTERLYNSLTKKRYILVNISH